VPITTAFNAPVREVPIENCYDIRCEKLEWFGNRGEKNEDVVTLFDRMYERDGQADRWTDRQTPHDGIKRAFWYQPAYHRLG